MDVDQLEKGRMVDADQEKSSVVNINIDIIKNMYFWVMKKWFSFLKILSFKGTFDMKT